MILSCTPWALCAITGRDAESVTAALLAQDSDDHVRAENGTVTAVRPSGAVGALIDLGYRVQRYTGPHPERPVKTWAESGRKDFPGEPLLLFTEDHCCIALDGIIFDTLAEDGAPAAQHPEAGAMVERVYRVQRRA